MENKQLEKLNEECTGSKDIYDDNSAILLHILKETSSNEDTTQYFHLFQLHLGKRTFLKGLTHNQ